MKHAHPWPQLPNSFRSMRESLMGEMPGEARYDENAMEVADALGWLNLQTDAQSTDRCNSIKEDPQAGP
jgi:hypothetical protein